MNRFKTFSVVAQILLINGVLFLVCNIGSNIASADISEYLAMPSNASYFLKRFYTPLTYMFSHLGFSHLFFNMFYFYFMGDIFSSIVGEKRLWFVYIMGGLAGALLFFIFSALFFGNASYLLGASAAVTAVAIVTAVYAPDLPVSVFFLGSFPLKWVVLVLFLLSTAIDISVNTGGKIAHLGGALFGLLYGLQLKKGVDLMDFFKIKSRSTKLKVVHHSEKYHDEPEEKVVNDILDKINRSGYESLSKQEKETLRKIASKK
ncbi:MAG: rhomboid family intramembrane serine protease [Bacteroidetes bacterium]|nr:rhomboid family intramembrane serine protease [Bacteroidota bacterium]